MGHRPDVPKRVRIRVHEPVLERRVVDVCVEVDDVDWLMPRLDDWRGHGMIATDDQRQRSPVEELLDRVGDIRPRYLCGSRQDVDVADVDDVAGLERLIEEHALLARVPVATRTKPQRVLPDPARA